MATVRRRPVPMRLQRDAALAQLGDLMRRLGMIPIEVQIKWELDHDPALGLRPVNAAGSDYDPPQHDLKCLIWRPSTHHRAKTTGRKGESRLSVSGDGDRSRIAKAARLAEGHEEFRRRLLARAPGEKHPRKGTMPSRPFDKTKTRKFNGEVVPR